MASIVSSKVTLTTKNYLAEAKMRDHYTVLDRPISKGGGDSGPTPEEYLLSAIAGCVAMTLRIYLEKNALNLGKITVEVFQHEKLTQNGIQKLIIEEISFEKEISEAQKKQLLIVAGTCPIIKMIKEATKVSSKIL